MGMESKVVSVLVQLTRSGALEWRAVDGEGSMNTKWRTVAEDGCQLELLRTGSLSFSGNEGESASEYISLGRVSTWRLVRAIDGAITKVRRAEDNAARERTLVSLMEWLQRSMK